MNTILLIDKGIMKGAAGVELRWCGMGGKIKVKSHQGVMYDGDKEVAAIVHWELPSEAMSREYHEETVIGNIKKHRWHCFTIKEYQDTKIYMMVAFGSPNELNEVHQHHTTKGPGPEGICAIHQYVDLCFDPENYCFDLRYLIPFIILEARKGMLMKLDPEGANSANKRGS